MAIEMKEINKSFGKEAQRRCQVLKQINLRIEDGEITAIMGRSGAGKSTLLHIIGCLDRPDSGSYLLDSEDVSTFSNAKLAACRNTRFGFVMQDFALIEDETVRQNIMLPTYFSKQKRASGCEELAKKLGIAQLLDKKVSLLSGGEKQRTAIARALINDPKYIIADEPTGALDSENARTIMQILLDLKQDKKTIIIVTHDIQVANLCDRTLYIKDGMIQQTDNEQPA